MSINETLDKHLVTESADDYLAEIASMGKGSVSVSHNGDMAAFNIVLQSAGTVDIGFKNNTITFKGKGCFGGILKRDIKDIQKLSGAFIIKLKSGAAVAIYSR